MRAASYTRARAFLKEQGTAQAWAIGLGVLQSLLAIKFLATAGLILALALTPRVSVIRSKPIEPKTPGGVRVCPALVNFPVSVQKKAVYLAKPDVWVLTNGGLTPTAVANLQSQSPARRLWGFLIRSQIRWIPALGTNGGALVFLTGAALTVLAVLSLVVRIRRSLVASLSGAVATNLRRLIHRQIYRLGQTALPVEGTGPVINMFTRDVNDVAVGVRADLEVVPATWILAIGLVLIPLLIAPDLFLSLVSIACLAGYAARELERTARRGAEIASREAAVQLCLLQEDLGLLRTVRVYGMESIDKQRFDEHLDRFSKAEERRVRAESFPDPAIFLLIGSSLVLTTGWLAVNVLYDRVSAAGAIVLFASTIGLAEPILKILSARRLIKQASRSSTGLFEFLERKPEIQQSVGANFLPSLKRKISFENVTVESMSGRTLLSGVSFEIGAGARASFMGMDEEAKYALACLIPRLLDPKTGRVRIDGLDLRDVTLESLRAQVATVLQSDLVFSDSVVANIGLGDPSFDLARVIEAAKIAHAHHFIQDLPDGYDTMIGPLGHYLTIDEQYRVALARAYLHDPSIVIVEEPNATLDDDVKHLVDDTIARIAPGRTMIFLPHRLSTIRASDQVILIHDARVEAVGSARELQQTSKLFRHLQYMEFNRFAAGEIEVGQMSTT
jgi:ABC-type multidrug transport system fused ATPase/permease subunit